MNRFFRERGPQSPVLCELLGEWVDWARTSRSRQDSIPKWWGDFLLYESLHVEIAARGRVKPSTANLAITASSRLIPQPHALLTHFAWTIHETTNVPPVPRHVALLGYCNEHYETRFLEVDYFATALWDVLFEQPVL